MLAGAALGRSSWQESDSGCEKVTNFACMSTHGHAVVVRNTLKNIKICLHIIFLTSMHFFLVCLDPTIRH